MREKRANSFSDSITTATSSAPQRAKSEESRSVCGPPSWRQALALLLHEALQPLGLFAEPIGIIRGAIEDRADLERLELALRGGLFRLCEQGRQLRIGKGPKRAQSFEGLVEDFHAVDAGNHDGGRQVEREVEAL